MARDRIEIVIRLVFGFIVFCGCFLVIEPFLTSILLSATISVVSWPLFQRAKNSFAGNATIASSVLVSLLVITILIPVCFLVLSISKQIPVFVNFVREWVAAGMPLPHWVANIPIIGTYFVEAYTYSLDMTAIHTLVERSLDPISKSLLSISLNVTNALVQLVLVAFIVFFFLRDGEYLSSRINMVLNRVSGGVAQELSSILVNTTRSVVFGVLGTAVLQGIVAGIGFTIASVPSVMFLSFAVTMLSIVPMGPPLVWGPVALWLYGSGSPGMAAFLVFWGVVAVSSVDNFIKPILISRGSTMPIALVFLGVFGGLISFGFLGLVLGPVFLSASIAMGHAWLGKSNGKTKEKPAKTPVSEDMPVPGSKKQR